jgi:hypothetical protein
VLASTQKRFPPYWRVTVDGARAPELAANGAFLAVALPPGRHVVEGRFVVPRIELAASAGGALAFLAVAWAAAAGNLKESAAR